MGNILLMNCYLRVALDRPRFFKAEGERSPSAAFDSALRAYWAEVETLMHALMRLSALALGLQEDFFEDAYREHHSVLRLAHYPRRECGADAAGSGAEAQLRYGEHSDYTGYTLLWQDGSTRPGMEARIGGEWVDVPPAQGRLSIVVNAGDLIEVWTNGRWVSPLHRVANAMQGEVQKQEQHSRHHHQQQEQQGRLSIVFFTGPSDDTTVSCLPGCGEPKHAPVNALQYLLAKLSASNEV